MKKGSSGRWRESVKLFSLTLCLMIFGLASMGVDSIEAGKNSESNVPFLFAVFAITWAAFFGYAFYIRRRQADLEREIAQLTATRKPSSLKPDDVNNLLAAFSKVRLPAPPTDCLSPIEDLLIKKGLSKAIDSRFVSTVTREPKVTNGNPFQVEVGLIFGGDVNGRFRAFDHETGDVLWEINLGSAVTGFPISYAVDGQQYVAVSTGSAGSASGFLGLTPELRPTAGNNIFVFALP